MPENPITIINNAVYNDILSKTADLNTLNNIFDKVILIDFSNITKNIDLLNKLGDLIIFMNGKYGSNKTIDINLSNMDIVIADLSLIFKKTINLKINLNLSNNNNLIKSIDDINIIANNIKKITQLNNLDLSNSLFINSPYYGILLYIFNTNKIFINIIVNDINIDTFNNSQEDYTQTDTNAQLSTGILSTGNITGYTTDYTTGYLSTGNSGTDYSSNWSSNGNLSTGYTTGNLSTGNITGYITGYSATGNLSLAPIDTNPSTSSTPTSTSTSTTSQLPKKSLVKKINTSNKIDVIEITINIMDDILNYANIYNKIIERKKSLYLKINKEFVNIKIKSNKSEFDFILNSNVLSINIFLLIVYYYNNKYSLTIQNGKLDKVYITKLNDLLLKDTNLITKLNLSNNKISDSDFKKIFKNIQFDNQFNLLDISKNILLTDISILTILNNIFKKISGKKITINISNSYKKLPAQTYRILPQNKYDLIINTTETFELDKINTNIIINIILFLIILFLIYKIFKKIRL